MYQSKTLLKTLFVTTGWNLLLFSQKECEKTKPFYNKESTEPIL